MLALAALLVATGCGPDEVQLPTAPMAAEMDALAASYENPTGTIDVANIESKLSAIEARLAELQLAWLPELMAEALARLAQRIADAAVAREADAGDAPTKHTIIDAVIDLRRVCKGWSDPAGAPDAAANGTVELTAVVVDGVVGQDVWGSASACRTRLDPLDQSSGLVIEPSVNLFIDGSLDVRLYGPLPRSVGEAKFLLLFNGRLGIDDRTTDSSIDFRVLDGHFAFRFAVSDGDVIVEVGATSISVRGSNAAFACDLVTRSCQ